MIIYIRNTDSGHGFGTRIRSGPGSGSRIYVIINIINITIHIRNINIMNISISNMIHKDYNAFETRIRDPDS